MQHKWFKRKASIVLEGEKTKKTEPDVILILNASLWFEIHMVFTQNNF